eukprot:TRINITY_DN3776_c0_g1_i1.p1 TRINITY_DN3776_c0_g1~~TRINITY_DN3776_c0_g1_i1.p1  ORF type:complete len:410 (-),score=140.07 TRINITY_DN3776_c0_g1_i1:107-1336(-)
MKRLLLLLIAVNIVVGDFIYSGARSNRFDPSLFSFYGNAKVADDHKSIIVSDSVASQKGAVWYKTPQDVTKGFQINFGIAIYGGDTIANGLSFVLNANPSLTSDTALGPIEADIAYDISNTVAIEIDTYYNAERHDVTVTHVGFQGCGPYSRNNGDHGGPCALLPRPVPIDSYVSFGYDFRPHLFNFVYDNMGKTFTAYLDGHQIFSTFADLTTLLNLIDGTSAYVGVTAATGQSLGRFDWLSMNFAEIANITEVIAPVYAGRRVLARGNNFKDSDGLSVYVNGYQALAKYVSENMISFELPGDIEVGANTIVASNDGVLHQYFPSSSFSVDELPDWAQPREEGSVPETVLIAVPVAIGGFAMFVGIGIAVFLRKSHNRARRHVPLEDVKQLRAEIDDDREDDVEDPTA